MEHKGFQLHLVALLAAASLSVVSAWPSFCYSNCGSQAYPYFGPVPGQGVWCQCCDNDCWGLQGSCISQGYGSVHCTGSSGGGASGFSVSGQTASLQPGIVQRVQSVADICQTDVNVICGVGSCGIGHTEGTAVDITLANGDYWGCWNAMQGHRQGSLSESQVIFHTENGLPCAGGIVHIHVHHTGRSSSWGTETWDGSWCDSFAGRGQCCFNWI